MKLQIKYYTHKIQKIKENYQKKLFKVFLITYLKKCRKRKKFLKKK